MASITYSTHFHLGASSVPRTLLVSTKSPPQSEGSAQFSAPPWALPCPVLFCLFLYCSLDRLTDTGGWSRWVRTLLAVCGEYREEGCSGSRRKAILFSENSCLRYFHDWWCLFVCDGCVYERVVGSWGPNQIKDVETKSFPKKLHICTTHNSKKKIHQVGKSPPTCMWSEVGGLGYNARYVHMKHTSSAPYHPKKQNTRDIRRENARILVDQ